MDRKQDPNELEATVRADTSGATWARILAAGAVITVVLTLVMVGLVRLGHALGSVRLAGSPAR